jgi:hypothetical protein
MSDSPDDEHEDQDATGASRPTGAAAEDPPEGDQDAGPASVPDPEATDAADGSE